MTRTHLERFEANRSRLFSLAYRLLGEASEAEDVLQDAYLRWSNSHEVHVAEAWLTRVVTNLCLNRLGSARARRERYVGTWLPEPVLTEGDRLGPLESVEQRESVSLGMLLLLERLTPPERAAFVLREAFGYGHREIAEILDVEEPHARQVYRRAREHVGTQRRRFDAEPEHSRRIVERFLAAATDGDVAELEALLAEDVVAWSDGGGRAPAIAGPLTGRVQVTRVQIALHSHPRARRARFTVRWVNGAPALLGAENGVLALVVVPEVVEGRIVAIRTLTNPDKLAFVTTQLQ
ncbi:RNA polymerase sigma-70 factor (ECF subfamily) [Lipingzhangella halophila]|uniref:RNA polymerase sigma-70 factor (ECF subfamily) n=1 Tax=Lipingzhangella halophila TaxID=1783352 RepID=A0A7W7RJ67_9ACTN|nr:RNA polymerase sigma factor SigJ [Lipingzhangella halophila]MBB4932900.1 RNA polymerase sigma-70 factor (ECF subfamily) [Lipingzhangella halophila]